MEQLQPYMPWIILGVTGLIAGWLVGLLLGGGGLFRNLVVGVLGALIGGAMVRMNLLNLPFDFGAFANGIVVATVGAFILVILARLIAR
ncbi:MAG: GlsB/YeaQ/YmgE family stress response membrane protein [Pseudomonadota bacterium]